MIKFPKIMSKHKKMSAFMISFSIHLAILVLAFFVAFTVIEKKDRIFEAPPKSRPSVKLRKLRVPVELEKNRNKK